MRGLRHRDQIHAAIGQRQALGRRHQVADAPGHARVGDLVGARVQADDLIEVRRKQRGQLAGAAADVDGKPAPRAQSRQMGRKLRRIVGPEPRIALAAGIEPVGFHVHTPEGGC